MTSVDYKEITTKEPHKPLTKRIKKHAGRNNQGKITVRHKGGGGKALYRKIDFKQEKIGIPAKVQTIEYDPNRTSFIALVAYKDGEKRYVLAPKDLKEGDEIITDEKAEVKEGNRMALRNIPVGNFVYNVEIVPGSGGKLGRSAGTSIQVMAHEGKYTHLKMPSGEIRKVVSAGFASVGYVSNPEHSLITIGKAGRSRWLGRRPTVRGSAMNPVDHPYGGGEGRAPRGTKYPKTKWGKITGGRKTRKKKKWSNKLIIKRRK